MAHYYPTPRGGCGGMPIRADPAAYYQPSPYATHTHAHYGAAPRLGQGLAPPQGKGGSQVAITVVALFAPWILFVAMFSVYAFYPHYSHPVLLQYLTAAIAAGVGLSTVLAVFSFRSAPRGRRDAAAWGLLIPATMLLAVGLGVVLGNETYLETMRPVYDILHLNEYDDIDPSATRGNQVMDGGRLSFVAGSRIDVSRVMSFRDLHTFCVAPIVSNDTQATGSYDFWAVGVDCCSGESGDFGACAPDKDDPSVHTALRVMEDSDMRMYRLAVEQAEGTFNIKATHPMFYRWMGCTGCELQRMQEAGYRLYFRSALVCLGVLGVVVWLASAAIARM